MERVLSVAGFEIITAATGQEACAAIESDKPDLIILSGRRGEWHNRVMQLFSAKSVLVKPVTSVGLIREVRGLLSIWGAYHG